MDRAAIAKKIRVARQQRQISQKEVAETIGIARTCYINLEHGKSFPKYDKMVAIAKLLRINLPEICAL